MATIKEVADRAGVSTATVSRVLNSNYPVSEATRKKVMTAVRETGYRINTLAKSLRTDKTYMIGLVVPDISNPYFMEIARGVETKVSELGYTLTFCSTDESQEKELRVLRALNDRRVDYVVLASSLQDSAPLKELMNQGLRIIMVDTILENLDVDYVVEENEEASYRLMDYALDQGHKKVGIVNGIMDISTARDRYTGYIRALEDHRITYDPAYTVNGGYYREIAYANVRKMLEKKKDELPTLIYATNNQMAEGTLMALKEMGLKVPEDISVVSFGDVTLPELVEPKMTIIQQDSRAIGEKAGDILLRRMENSGEELATATYTIKSELIVRDSVRTQ